MFGEEKRPIINVNLKKHPRHIQHPVTDLKMELLVINVNDFKLSITFAKSSISDLSQVLSSPLATINQVFLTTNKRATSWFFGTVSLTT